MGDKARPHAEVIRAIVRKMNDAWLGKRYEDIGEYLDPDVVIASDSGERVCGRDAIVDSYRKYDAAATTHEFVPGDIDVDVVGDTAVAVCPFRVTYELGGRTYRETGKELLVLSQASGEWKVVWRTVQADSLG